MERERWQDILLPPGNEDQVWELFHENSKVGPYSRFLSDQDVQARMKELHESLPFEGYPLVDLPTPFTPLCLSLDQAIVRRTSTRNLIPSTLSLETLTTLLHYGYGITRDNIGTSFPRPFRVVPSGGALYPLELFFHGPHIEGLPAGLYHYNPTQHHLRRLREGDDTQQIAEAMVQPDLASGASLILFLTAIFERSVFKYDDRGYRFILLEAGHVAQNINLVSTALDLGCVNIGGYFDRQLDSLLGLDGVTHSTIYLIAIGTPKSDAS